MTLQQPKLSSALHSCTATAFTSILLTLHPHLIPTNTPTARLQLLSIVHTKRFDADSYENMALTTSPEPPFAITSIGRPLPLACRGKTPTDMQAGD